MPESQDPIRILVVEDELSLSKSLKHNLGKRGYKVECTDSVEAAIPLLDRFQPHILLTDGALPGAAGMSLASYIRREDKHKDIKVVAMSGDPGQKRLIHVMKKMIHAFIEKPFTTDQLVDVLEQVRPGPGKPPQKA